MKTAPHPDFEARLAPIRATIASLIPEQRRLLAALLVLSRRHGYSWAQQRVIAERVNSPRTTVAGDLRLLAGLGLIRVVKPDMAAEFGFTEAMGRSDVIVPVLGVDQVMAELRAADAVRDRAARAGSVRVGRPRGILPRNRPRTAQVANPKFPTVKTSNSSDRRPEFRPKDSESLKTNLSHSVSISSRKSIATQASRVRDAPRESDPQPVRDDTIALMAEGLTPVAATNLARAFASRPGVIARNITLGEHRTKANPPGWLTTAIRGDYASVRVSPDSEAAAVRRSEQPSVPRSRPASPPGEKAVRTLPPAALWQSVPLAIAPSKATSMDLSPETRERLTVRAWEDVRKTHAYLGIFSQEHPVIRGAISRAVRKLYELETTSGNLLPMTLVHLTEHQGNHAMTKASGFVALGS